MSSLLDSLICGAAPAIFISALPSPGAYADRHRGQETLHELTLVQALGPSVRPVQLRPTGSCPRQAQGDIALAWVQSEPTGFRSVKPAIKLRCRTPLDVPKFQRAALAVAAGNGPLAPPAPFRGHHRCRRSRMPVQDSEGWFWPGGDAGMVGLRWRYIERLRGEVLMVRKKTPQCIRS